MRQVSYQDLIVITHTQRINNFPEESNSLKTRLENSMVTLQLKYEQWEKLWSVLENANSPEAKEVKKILLGSQATLPKMIPFGASGDDFEPVDDSEDFSPEVESDPPVEKDKFDFLEDIEFVDELDDIVW